MSNNKKVKKTFKVNNDVWSEEQFEEYIKELYGMDFIAGYTENGIPYGTFTDENEENYKINNLEDEDLPFQ